MWGKSRTLAILASIFISSTASAQTVEIKPLLDARVRYENVQQEGLTNDADALSTRLRSGLQLSSDKWSAIVETEATLALVGDYNDGTNGKTAYPNVIDPHNIELNRMQLRYADGQRTTVTMGRQILELADERFVGSSNFRQNQQTFDAVRVQHTLFNGVTADISYAWSDRTINGINGEGARQQAVEGDNLFALLGIATPIGAVTGFAYLVDQDEAAVQGFKLSSQTYGVRLMGSTSIGKAARFAYVASWARQSDYHRNPNEYAANYLLAEATLTKNSFSLSAGYEVLGADNGVALTSVQTPLASLFKFQGWADKFTTTPPDGVRDLYGNVGGTWKKVGFIDILRLSAGFHRFESDRLIRHYGNEIDLLASIKMAHYTIPGRYARYRADSFAVNTDKIWITLEWSL